MPKWFNMCALKKNPEILSVNTMKAVNDTAQQLLQTDITGQTKTCIKQKDAEKSIQNICSFFTMFSIFIHFI